MTARRMMLAANWLAPSGWHPIARHHVVGSTLVEWTEWRGRDPRTGKTVWWSPILGIDEGYATDAEFRRAFASVLRREPKTFQALADYDAGRHTR